MNTTTDNTKFLSLTADLLLLRPILRAECICNSFGYAGGCSWNELSADEQQVCVLFLAYADIV